MSGDREEEEEGEDVIFQGNIYVLVFGNKVFALFGSSRWKSVPRVYLAPCLKSKQPNKEIFLNRVCFFFLELYTKPLSFGPAVLSVRMHSQRVRDPYSHLLGTSVMIVQRFGAPHPSARDSSNPLLQEYDS